MLPVAEVNDFIAPAAGLLGVLVGGYLTRSIEEDRRKHHDASETAGRHKRVALVARVVSSELTRVSGYVAAMREHGTWLSPSIADLSTESHYEDQLLLADALGDAWYTYVRALSRRATVFSTARAQDGAPINALAQQFLADVEAARGCPDLR